MTPFPFGNVAPHYRLTFLAMLPFYSALGCLGTNHVGTTAVNPRGASAQHVVQVPGTVVTSDEALSVDDLFSRGLHRFEQRRYSLAASDLEIAARSLAASGQIQLAWYRAAIARDESGDFKTATEDFNRAITCDELSALARDARVRLIRLLVFLERWADAGEQARWMAHQYQNLHPVEAIVVKGAWALDALSNNDWVAAAREIEGARTIIEDKQFDVATRLQRDVAIVYFALGELRRLRAAELRFVPLPPNFGEQLERRCQLLLDAQSAYSMAMRAYDAHWSVISGYRVSQLYEELHHDLMQVLPLVQLPDPEHRSLLEAALRLRYTILLDKAASGLNRTLALAVRTDENSKWVALAKQALENLRVAMADEQASLAEVPYTREELRRAIERLDESRRSLPSKKK